MRSPTACGLLTATLCGLLTAVRCELDVHGLQSAAPETIRKVLRAVLAQDDQWRDVLMRRVEHSWLWLTVFTIAELQEMWKFNDTVQQVVAKLATDRAATTSKLRFGAFVLGKALSCSFLDTLLLHAFYTLVLGRRNRVDAAALGQCLSAIRAALAVYVDKLVAFGQDVQPFVEFNHTVNKALASLPDKTTFVKHVDQLIERAETAFKERCDSSDVGSTIKNLGIDSDNWEMRGWTVVSDERLVDMVKDVDGYEYVSLHSYGPDKWMMWLNDGKAFDGGQHDRTPDENPEDGQHEHFFTP